MPLKTLKPSLYKPSSPRTGNDRRTLFRAQNVWIRGSDGDYYAECYQGSENLGEPIATTTLFGSHALTANSKLVVGTGSLYASELHPGQFLIIGNFVLVVDYVVNDTHFYCHRAPDASVSGLAGFRLPVLFELDKKRATMTRGNAKEFDQGHIIAVGDGELKLNGASLPGGAFIASRSPKLAKYDPVTGNYTVYTLGSIASPPTGITAINVAGGTKGMTAGARGLRFCKGRAATGGGYGNPSDNIVVTLAANERIQITFPPMDTGGGQDLWIVFCTVYQSATSVSSSEGPWYKTLVLTKTDVSAAGGTYTFEFLNSEVNKQELLSFNNDAPTDAEFVEALTGYPIYVSCQGKGTAAKPNGTSPGPFIVPAKPSNWEAAPLELPNPVATSPPETILGAIAAAGRLYLLTSNRLCFASFTNLPTAPLTIRPFWKVGFANPYNLTFVKSQLFGFTHGGLMRSAVEGEEGGEDNEFAEDVEEITKDWNAGHGLVGHDPKNKCVCFFYSGAYKNSNGWWVTVILPYMLEKGFWNPPIVLSYSTQDAIVSGVATINGRLEFIAGGRTNLSTVTFNSFRFDTATGESVPWYMAWNYSDDGAEQNAKVVKGFRLSGNTTSGSLGIHGSRSSSTINVAALEAGNSGAASGSISITNKTQLTLNGWIKRTVRELLLYTVRIDGTWAGTGERDRVDEIALQVEQGGLRK